MSIMYYALPPLHTLTVAGTGVYAKEQCIDGTAMTIAAH